MQSTDWAREALELFDHAVATESRLRLRAGQRDMAACVAQTLAHAELGKPASEEGDEGLVTQPSDEPQRALAVIQAGTGVGKSLAYGLPAIALALSRNTRVVISTATVALQEQLVNKDLPAMAALLPQPFRYALAKGRGRYVCKLKLDRQVALARGEEAEPDELDAEDDLFGGLPGVGGKPHTLHEADRKAIYLAMHDDLNRGRWNGDRDMLGQPPDGQLWQSVAAEASSCTARHCPQYSQCSYYEQRKALVGAQVVVVNHDLLLSTLGSNALPALDNSLLVLDEAHHLPATALDQFASHMDVSRLGWVDKLSSRALKVGGLLAVEDVADIPKHAALVRQGLQDVARLLQFEWGHTLREQGKVRLAQGRLPDPLVNPLSQLAHSAQVWMDALRAISKALRAEMRDHPQEAAHLARHYAQLGALAPRLEAVYATTQLWLQMADNGSPPVAKWLTQQVQGDLVVLHAHASPILPGSTLRHHLWGAVRGAVLTSATLTSLGRFDFFLREVGLADDPDVTTLEVASPFDFAKQGTLGLPAMQNDPKAVQAFTTEMVQALLADIRQVKRGALVLFTSRDQMRQAVEALPADLRERVLVQNEQPRTRLLQAHQDRVAQGLPSVLFGLQSFGEGLDLPGDLCRDLFITKLPFMPPDDPVGEARAEWLRQSGRDPFMELVVPATAMRLAQWVGRAIRTEDDTAHVVCYDRRLANTSYGQRLLAGLPPFKRV